MVAPVPWVVLSSGDTTRGGRPFRDVRRAARVLVAATVSAKGRGVWWGRVLNPEGEVALKVELTPGEPPHVWALTRDLGEHGFALLDAAKGRTSW
jgi:hypothetical protein